MTRTPSSILRIATIPMLALLALLAGCGGSSPEAERVTVEPGTRVTMEFRVMVEDDTVIDSSPSGEPLTFVFGQRRMVPGLEKLLAGMAAGEEARTTVGPAEAYGPTNPAAIQEMLAERIPEDARFKGGEFTGQNPDGKPFRGRVLELLGETARVDFNHPLAGRSLTFEVKVLSVEPRAPA